MTVKELMTYFREYDDVPVYVQQGTMSQEVAGVASFVEYYDESNHTHFQLFEDTLEQPDFVLREMLQSAYGIVVPENQKALEYLKTFEVSRHVALQVK